MSEERRQTSRSDERQATDREDFREILRLVRPGARVLDVGCGEGATLKHLGAPPGAVGVDLFEEKVRFARTHVPPCTFVAASAYELPFEAGAFDHVLVRDVIHHLDQPERFVRECRRVLAAGGRIDVLEPCRNNPLVFAHGMLLPVERGELRSTMSHLTDLLSGTFEVVETQRFQALPISRIVFHPQMGRPDLAQVDVVRGLVDLVERAAERVLPAPMRMYMRVRAVRPASA